MTHDPKLCARCQRVWFVGAVCPWCGCDPRDVTKAKEARAMTEPIRPEDVDGKKQIPSTVFEVFNELIAKNMQGSTSVVKQADVVNALCERGMQRDAVFANHYLDVEPSYEKAGWKVTYSKPGYNELGESTFTFERPVSHDAFFAPKKEQQS